MSIVLLRIDHPAEPSLTERFLIDCTARQESLLRRANRKLPSKDRNALFITLLCYLMPKGETLSARKMAMQQAITELKDSLIERNDQASKDLLPIVSGLLSSANTFFASPYGMFKVSRSPLSILDMTSPPDYKVSTVIITNDLDPSILPSIKKED